MSITTLLKQWQLDSSIGPNIARSITLPAKKAQRVEFPADLHPQLRTELEHNKITGLYQHQLAAWEMVAGGNHTAIVTGTASGKTLAYTLPILDEAYKNPHSRALLLFPSKALAHDQLTALRSVFNPQAAAYDGDTPKHHRQSIRKTVRLLVTNPDMLHLGILPHHTSWEQFFSRLKFVVLDEMHTYRGVFGSHVANILRRLNRVALHYGSQLQFILTSATIGNPQELAETLLDQPVSVISQDASERGQKHFLLYNPPIIDERLGLRASMQRESVHLVCDLVQEGLQTILFGRSRKTVEHLLDRLRKTCSARADQFSAYRSGYLPATRREIEEKLRSQDLKAVISTNALELGIDIGGLDAAVLAGYPGSIASVWQQAGRSGRSSGDSLAVFVASSNPLDQFFIHHPEYFFQTNPEQALLDPNNLLILLDHIRCACFELPFQTGESFGTLSPSQTQAFLDVLSSSGSAYASGGETYWMDDSYPAGDISLRTSSNQDVILQVAEPPDNKVLLGTVDRESAPWMVHPGAIYLQQGESYLVDSLDLSAGIAALTRKDPDYYTEPETEHEVDLLQQVDSTSLPGGGKGLGEIKVTTLVTGYKRISWERYEVIDRKPLSLSPLTLETSGFWLYLGKTIEDTLRQSGVWASGPLDYGSDWPSIRKRVLARDRSTCQVCGKRSDQIQLHIHHKAPLRSFLSVQVANQLENLITLCPRCHQRAESIVRVKSGLAGLGYLLHHLAPMLVMCDPRDLGVHLDPLSDLADGRPTLILFEHIPAGLGYSRRLYEQLDDLLNSALELVRACPCQTGCPSCVGPGGEQGAGGKMETIAILEELG